MGNERKFPAFSSFRGLLTLWEEHLLKEEKKKEDKQGKVKNVIDGQNLIIFFKKGDSVFGAPEDSRIVFARMMNPTDDEPLPDDASFSAFDLIQALNGNSAETLFSQPDLAKIDVITRDQAEDALMKCPETAPQTAHLQPIKVNKDVGASGIDLQDEE